MSSTAFRRATIVATIVAAASLLPTVALAKGPGERSNKSDKQAFFDSRQTPAAKQKLKKKEKQIVESPRSATEALEDSLGSEGVVAIDPLTSTPRMVGRLDGFLTGTSSAAAQDVALGYVRGNAAAFGLDAQAIAGLQLTRDYVSIDGTHHLFFTQKVNGVPVFGNGVKANVTKDGKLINVLGSPVASSSAGSATPGISASTAVAQARSDVEEGVVPYRSAKGGEVTRPTTFSNGDRASLVYFVGVDGLRLAWQSYVSGNAGAFLHVIDASSGAVLYRRSLVDNADALVYENFPGAPNGGTQEQKSISQNGWLTSASTLTGPNTHVYSDLDDSNDSTNADGLAEEIPPSGGGDWLYPITSFNAFGTLGPAYGCGAVLCTWDPVLGTASGGFTFEGAFSYEVNQFQDGAQLFYHVNTFHDHLAAAPIGFTQAAGNFEGDDPVLGEAIDGANTYAPAGLPGYPDPNHTDNANMATPPDGFSPRMQMYLWHDPTANFFADGPSGDPFSPTSGSNEADIVYHEYTHGLSNRLVVDSAGNSTLGNVQAGAMGEAWSDWYAFDFLVKQGLVADTSASGELRLGAYVANNQDLIRTEPIDCAVGADPGVCPGGAPEAGTGGYTYGDFGKIIGRPEVHADGEIWVQTLWDLRNALGSETSESLITRAMELSPANPSFLDMRNSILQADVVAGGGSRDTIWNVFAARGMGYFAAATNGDDPEPVEDFSQPPGPKAKTAKLKGTVTDQDTNESIGGVLVAFGGHASGFPGDFAGVTKNNGNYDIKKIFVGTYPKVSASGAGYDQVVRTVTIKQGNNVENFQLRRDWAALGGGGSISEFTGPDYTDFGCGPTGAIDQSQGNGWGSTTDGDDGVATGNVTPKHIVVKLPQAVDVAEIFVNPSATCGDAGSASTKDYRLETSGDGSSWTMVKEGSFGTGDRGQYVSIAGLDPAGLPAVQYLRFTMLNPQVPLANGTLPPFGSSGVPDRCGPGAPNPGNFSGCAFMDMTEIGVYGKPS
jgi:extracellular elastinolytic metalloproteinase